MNNNELSTGTKDEQRTTADILLSASVEANPMLPAVLFVGAKLYRTNYNSITEVLTIERVTKTQAISGFNKFRIELSSYGTAYKMGSTDRWSSASYYLETPELKEKLWKQEAVQKLSKVDYSKLSTKVLKELLSLINGR